MPLSIFDCFFSFEKKFFLDTLVLNDSPFQITEHLSKNFYCQWQHFLTKSILSNTCSSLGAFALCVSSLQLQYLAAKLYAVSSTQRKCFPSPEMRLLAPISSFVYYLLQSKTTTWDLQKLAKPAPTLIHSGQAKKSVISRGPCWMSWRFSESWLEEMRHCFWMIDVHPIGRGVLVHTCFDRFSVSFRKSTFK